MVPLKKLTTPCSELSGLVMLSRLITAVLTVLVDMPSKIILMGDSTSTIPSVECKNHTLNLYFPNRCAEVLDHMATWSKQTKVDGPTTTPPGRQTLLALPLGTR